jgi:sarcosine oxidase subunit beta
VVEVGLSMTETSDVLIVGAGIAGVTLALELASAGRSVTVLERRHVGAGSSSLNAGGVRQQFSQELNVRLASRTVERIAGFRERYGEDIGYRQVGYLLAYESVADERLLAAAMAVQNRCDVPTRSLSLDEVGEAVPGIDVSGLRGAVFCPTDGYVDPRATVTGFGRAARRAGARFVIAEATTIEVSGGRVVTVVAGSRRFSAGVVVNAAGPWAASLAHLYGGDLPITPLRSEIFVLDHALVQGRVTPMVLDYQLGLAFHTEGRGLLISAGITDVVAEPPATVSPVPEHFADIRARIARRLPETAGYGLAHSWAGLIEVTPDNNPIVGWTHLDNLFTVAGFSGHGMCLAPGLAPEAARLLQGERPRLPIEAYALDRFSRPASIQAEEVWSGARAYELRQQARGDGPPDAV